MNTDNEGSLSETKPLISPKTEDTSNETEDTKPSPMDTACTMSPSIPVSTPSSTPSNTVAVSSKPRAKKSKTIVLILSHITQFFV